MISKYPIFFINGVLFGLLSWLIQITILSFFVNPSSYQYSFSVFISFSILIYFNFLSQKNIIFKKKGLFLKFLIANIFIMALITFSSPIIRLLLLDGSLSSYANLLSYPITALLFSFLSYYLKYKFVFK